MKKKNETGMNRLIAQIMLVVFSTAQLIQPIDLFAAPVTSATNDTDAAPISVTPVAPPLPNTLSSDITGDGRVDWQDLAEFIPAYGSTDPSVLSRMDLDSSGKIDALDIDRMRIDFAIDDTDFNLVGDDGLVTREDLNVLVRHLGSDLTQRNYHPRADLYPDGTIDARDYLVLLDRLELAEFSTTGDASDVARAPVLRQQLLRGVESLQKDTSLDSQLSARRAKYTWHWNGQSADRSGEFPTAALYVTNGFAHRPFDIQASNDRAWDLNAVENDTLLRGGWFATYADENGVPHDPAVVSNRLKNSDGAYLLNFGSNKTNSDEKRVGVWAADELVRKMQPQAGSVAPASAWPYDAPAFENVSVLGATGDWDGSVYQDPQAYRAALADYLDDVRINLRAEFLPLYTSVAFPFEDASFMDEWKEYLSHVDGILDREAFGITDKGAFLRTSEMAGFESFMSYYEEVLSQGKILLLSAVTSDFSYGADAVYRDFLYTFSSYLLLKEPGRTFYGVDFGSNNHLSAWARDLELDLGKAQGKAQSVSDSFYYRAFDYGLVLVNPTEKDHIVNLGALGYSSALYDKLGQHVEELTLSAGAGVMLFTYPVAVPSPDISGDGHVDLRDLQTIHESWDENIQSSGFHELANLNGDLIIDYEDLKILAAAFRAEHDVNHDGVIDQGDADYIREYLTFVIGSENYDAACDLNADGHIDEEDIKMLGSESQTGTASHKNTSPPSAAPASDETLSALASLAGESATGGNTDTSEEESPAALATVGQTPPLLEPVGNAVKPRKIAAGRTLRIPLRASDVDASDNLTFSMDSEQNLFSMGATLTPDPVNPNRSAVLNWTPSAAQTGTYYADFRTSDSFGMRDEQSYAAIQVVDPNSEEEISITGVEQLSPEHIKNQPASFVALATSTFGDPLEYRFTLTSPSSAVTQMNWQDNYRLDIGSNVLGEVGNYLLGVEVRSKTSMISSSLSIPLTFAVTDPTAQNMFSSPLPIRVIHEGKGKHVIRFYSNPRNTTITHYTVGMTPYLPAGGVVVPVPDPAQEASLYEVTLDCKTYPTYCSAVKLLPRDRQALVIVNAFAGAVSTHYGATTYYPGTDLPVASSVSVNAATQTQIVLDVKTHNPGSYFNISSYNIYEGTTLRGTYPLVNDRLTVGGLAPFSSYTFTLRPVDAQGWEGDGATTIEGAKKTVTVSTLLGPGVPLMKKMNGGNYIDAGQSLQPLSGSLYFSAGGNPFHSVVDQNGNLMYLFSSAPSGKLMGRFTSSKKWEIWSEGQWSGSGNTAATKVDHAVGLYGNMSIFSHPDIPGGLLGTANEQFSIGSALMDTHGMPANFIFDGAKFTQWKGGASYHRFMSLPIINSWGGTSNGPTVFAFDPASRKGVLIGPLSYYIGNFNAQLTAVQFRLDDPAEKWRRWNGTGWHTDASWPDLIDPDILKNTFILNPNIDVAKYKMSSPLITHLKGTSEYLLSFIYKDIETNTVKRGGALLNDSASPVWSWWNGTAWTNGGTFDFQDIGGSSNAVKDNPTQQIYWDAGKVVTMTNISGDLYEVVYDHTTKRFSAPLLVARAKVGSQDFPRFALGVDSARSLWLAYSDGYHIKLRKKVAPTGVWSDVNLAYENTAVDIQPFAVHFVGPNEEPAVFIAENGRLALLAEQTAYWNGEVGRVSMPISSGSPLNAQEFTLGNIIDTASHHSYGGSVPGHLTVDRDGYIYAPKFQVSDIAVIPPNAVGASDNKIWSPFWDLMRHPHGLAIDYDKSKVYVASELMSASVGGFTTSGEVAIWDLDKRDSNVGYGFLNTPLSADFDREYAPAIIKNNFSWPSDVAVDEARGLLYVSNSGYSKIDVFDIHNVTNSSTPFSSTGLFESRISTAHRIYVQQLVQAMVGQGFLATAGTNMLTWVSTDLDAVISFIKNHSLYLQLDAAEDNWDFIRNVTAHYKARRDRPVYLHSFGSEGSGAGQFLFPQGIDLDKDGNAYVVDSENHRIQKWLLDPVTKRQQFAAAWGKLGTQAGVAGDIRFRYPGDIAVDDLYGRVYVADTGNARFTVLDTSGNFLYEWSELTLPPNAVINQASKNGIYADDRGTVYAALDQYVMKLTIPDVSPTVTVNALPAFLAVGDTVHITGSVSDDWGVVAVDLLVNAQVVDSRTLASVKNASFDFTWTPSQSGATTIQVRARDIKGQEVEQYHTVSVASTDADGDGLSDDWEQQYFGNLNQTPSGDPDGDGLSNQAEWNAGTNPNNNDTDGDGILDGNDLDPLVHENKIPRDKLKIYSINEIKSADGVLRPWIQSYVAGNDKYGGDAIDLWVGYDGNSILVDTSNVDHRITQVDVTVRIAFGYNDLVTPDKIFVYAADSIQPEGIMRPLLLNQDWIFTERLIGVRTFQKMIKFINPVTERYIKIFFDPSIKPPTGSGASISYDKDIVCYSLDHYVYTEEAHRRANSEEFNIHVYPDAAALEADKVNGVPSKKAMWHRFYLTGAWEGVDTDGNGTIDQNRLKVWAKDLDQAGGPAFWWSPTSLLSGDVWISGSGGSPKFNITYNKYESPIKVKIIGEDTTYVIQHLAPYSVPEGSKLVLYDSYGDRQFVAHVEDVMPASVMLSLMGSGVSFAESISLPLSTNTADFYRIGNSNVTFGVTAISGNTASIELNLLDVYTVAQDFENDGMGVFSNLGTDPVNADFTAPDGITDYWMAPASDSGITYRAIQGKGDEEKTVLLKIPNLRNGTNPFKVNSFGVPEENLILEIRYLDVIDEDDHWKSTQTFKYGRIHLDAPVRFDVGPGEDSDLPGAANRTYPYKAYWALGGENDGRWKTRQVLLEKDALFPALMTDSPQDDFFTIRLCMPLQTSKTGTYEVPIDYVLLRKATDDEMKFNQVHYREEEGLFPYPSQVDLDQMAGNLAGAGTGFSTFVVNTAEVIYPWMEPQPYHQMVDDGAALEAISAKDQYEPFSFTVRAHENMKVTGVQVTGLDPRLTVEVEYIKAHDQTYTGRRPLLSYAELGELIMPIPAEGVAIAVNKNQQFWITIRIPSDMPAGHYTGTVQLTSDVGNIQIPLTLDVADIMLSDSVAAHYVGNVRKGETGPIQANYETMQKFGLNAAEETVKPSVVWGGNPRRPLRGPDGFFAWNLDNFGAYLDALMQYGISNTVLVTLVLAHDKIWAAIPDPFYGTTAYDYNNYKIPYTDEGGYPRELDARPAVDLFRAEYKHLIQLLKNEGAARNIKLIFRLSDEPRDDPAKRRFTKMLSQLILEAGGETYTSYHLECENTVVDYANISNRMNANAFYAANPTYRSFFTQELGPLQDALDYKPSDGIPPINAGKGVLSHRVYSPSQISGAGLTDSHARGIEAGYYTTYSANLPNATMNRFLHGWFAERMDSKIIWAYAWFDTIGMQDDDMDQGWTTKGYTFQDFMLAYQSWQGNVYPTIELASLREGIKDSRYIATVKDRIAAIRTSGIPSVQALADHAEDFIENTTSFISAEYYPDYYNVALSRPGFDLHTEMLNHLPLPTDNPGNPFSIFDELRRKAIALILQMDLATGSDTDGDGLPDAWEMQYFENLDQTAAGDPDGDGLSNLEEFNAGSDPNVDDGGGPLPNAGPMATANSVYTAKNVPLPVKLSGTDSDGHVTHYRIEVAPSHGNLDRALMVETPIASLATYAPNAGYQGIDQFRFAVKDNNNAWSTQNAAVDVTVYSDVDSDADSIPDEWEYRYFPGDLTRLGGLDINEIERDYDADILSDLGEYQAGTNPTNRDTDGDSLWDGQDPDPLTVNLRPVANAGATALRVYDQGGDGTEIVTLNASYSYSPDPARNVVWFHWQEQNGAGTVPLGNVQSAPIHSHPLGLGSHAVTLTVRDDLNVQNSAALDQGDQVTILVTNNRLPFATPMFVTTTQNVPVSFTPFGIDQDGFVTHVRPINLPTYGTLSVGSTPVVINNEIIAFIPITYTPNVNHTGADKFVFQVKDNRGEWGGNAEVNITIQPSGNSAPVYLGTIVPQTIAQGAAFASFNLDNYFSDADHADSQLTMTAIGNTNLIVTINPTTHTTTIAAPNANWVGSESITFKATDPIGAFASSPPIAFTVSAPPSNPAPVYVGTITPQTITEGGTFAAFDLDTYFDDANHTDSQLTMTASGQSNLIVNINASTHLVSITPPNADWSGSESITFKATDPLGAFGSSVPVMFAVTAVNDKPVYVGTIPSQSIQEGNSFTGFDLDPYFNDVDHTDAQLTMTVTGQSSLTVSINPTNHLVTVTAPPNWWATEQLVFKATDPLGQFITSGPVSFTVTPMSTGPHYIRPILPQTIQEGVGGFVSFDLDSFFDDPDDTDDELQMFAHGNTFLRITIDPLTHVVAISPPNPDWNGKEDITFQAVDPSSLSGYSSPVAFTVNGTNDPPVYVSTIPSQTVTEGGTFTTIDLNTYFEDPDHADSQLTFTVSGNNRLGVQINTQTHTATVTAPDALWSGIEALTFKATDPLGLNVSSGSVTFTVTDVTHSPTYINTIPSQTIDEGGTFTTIDLNTYFDDQDHTDSQLTFSATGQAQLQVSINTTTHVATVSTPNVNWFGTESIVFNAKDPDNQTGQSNPIIFTARSINDAPVFVGTIAHQTHGEGCNCFLVIDLNQYFNDVDHTDAQLTMSVTGQTALLVTINPSTHIADVHAPNLDWYGAETLTFKATDPSGAVVSSNAVTFTVTNVNDAPKYVGGIVNQTISEGQAFATFDLDNAFDDLDNVDSQLAMSVTGASPLLVNIDAATHVATVTTPNVDWAGVVSMAFWATDPSNSKVSSGSIFYTVSNVNDAPQAFDDAATVGKNTQSNLQVLANDKDADHDALTVLSTTDPPHGTVAVSTDKLFVTYTPDTDYVGTDSFDYVISDPSNVTDIGKVTITVQNTAVPPIAQFSATPTNGTLPLTVQFTDQSTGDVSAWLWNFGDGGTSAAQHPSHVFTQAGTYAVSLTASGSAGSATLSKPGLIVVQANPDSDGDGIQDAWEYQYFPNDLTKLGGLDGQGAPRDFDDDGLSDLDEFIRNSNPIVADTDGDGIVDGIDQDIFNINHVPIADASATAVNVQDTDGDGTVSVILDGSRSSHPETPHTVQSYSWYERVSPGAQRFLGTTAKPVSTLSTPLTVGTHTIELVVVDDRGYANDATKDVLDVVTVVVSPANVGPTASAQSVTTPEDTAQSVTLSGVDSDGQVTHYKIVSLPTHGILNVSIDTETSVAVAIVYTPAPNYFGADGFTFLVKDNSGVWSQAPAAVSLTVTAVNDSPVPTAQTVQTTEDTAKSITLAGGDVDGQTTHYRVKTLPLHGALDKPLTIEQPIATPIVFTPAANYTGTDSFAFEVKDNTGAWSTTSAAVSITISTQNDAPIVQNQSVDTDEDKFILIDLSVGASDADGDALRFRITRMPLLTEGILMMPSGGSITTGQLLPAGVQTVKFVPAQGYTLPVSFDYSASDGTLDSAAATVTVRIHPMPRYTLTVVGGTGDGVFKAGETVPISADPAASGQEFNVWVGEDITDPIAPDTTILVNQDKTVTATFRAVDACAANSPPIANAGADRTVIEGTQITLSGHQSFDADGAIALFNWDMGNGDTRAGIQVTYTYNQPGDYIVTLTVADGCGSVAADTLTVRIFEDQSPTVILIKPTPQQDGVGFFTFEALATDDMGVEHVEFIDQTTGLKLGDGELSSDPADVNIYELRYDTTQLADGVHQITARAVDTKNHVSDSAPAELFVRNHPPRADFMSDVTAGDAPLTVQFTNISTGPNISATVWDFGDGSTSEEEHPLHTYLLPGSYTVTLAVGNPAGDDVEMKVSYITVNADHPASDFSSDQRIGFGPLTVNFLDRSVGNVTTWKWNFGDGTTSTEQNPTHTYTKTGWFTVSLTVTGAGTGRGSVRKFFYVRVLKTRTMRTPPGTPP